ncbi:MAG: tetratricopeptide repeat protein [Candidatus Obscuribacterales bacterium]|nr:tetratricopeptide repeat protein [Candidatus Obscuribacterales bacterium]
MRYLSLVLLSLAIMLSVPAWADDSNSEGIKAYRMGDYARAEQLYRQALTEKSNNYELAAVYRNLSILYEAQGKDGSEFSRKADQLFPPDRPAYIKAPAAAGLSGASTEHSALPAVPSGASTGAIPAAGSAGRGVSVLGGTGVFGSSSMSSSTLNGSYNLNQPGAGRGGILNGGFGGAARFNSGNGFSGYGGYGGLGNSYYSSSSPNGVFEYSSSTPMVLPAPNGGAIILNAPGPNIYSSQQGADGSTTTIMKRTY